MADPRLRLLGAVSSADADRLLAALDSIRPIVIVAPGLPAPAVGAALTLLAILSRMFPHVQVTGFAAAGPDPWNIADVADAQASFQAVRPAPAARPSTDVFVTVGPAAKPLGNGTVLGIGGGDWTARLGWSPQPLDNQATALGHGLGLHAAACLAAGELLKMALMPLGMPGLALTADGVFVWNLIDYRHAAGPAADSLHPAPRPLRVLMAGAGSVGTSAAGVLVFCRELRGEVTIADPEDFDASRNPFRYPALAGGETGPKAAWAADLLARSGWAASPHLDDIASWNTGCPQPGFDGILVSSVDDLAARFDLADVLARSVISAGVGGLAFHVQREQLGDGWACPCCEYVPADPILTQAHLIASQAGLPLERVIALQLPRAVLTEGDLQCCVAAGRIPGQAAASLAGHRLADLLAGIYAEAAVQVTVPDTEAGPPGTLTVAAPHVSWLTGVIIAAELVKAASGLPELDRRIDIDMSGLPQGFVRRVRADSSGRCACASGLRRRWMVNLYGGRG